MGINRDWPPAMCNGSVSLSKTSRTSLSEPGDKVTAFMQLSLAMRLLAVQQMRLKETLLLD